MRAPDRFGVELGNRIISVANLRFGPAALAIHLLSSNSFGTCLAFICIPSPRVLIAGDWPAGTCADFAPLSAISPGRLDRH
jgi:hypothetical protein